MPNWTESMIQTFEYYKVDPNTWKDEELITSITETRIDRDSGAETLGTASLTTSEMLGECYIRIYLITIQNDIREKFPLGTYMIQTPSFNFDGKIKTITMDAYTPLIELKEKRPPIGYFIPKEKIVMTEVYTHMRDNMRAPIVETISDDDVPYDFVSNNDDTWLTYITDLISLSKYSIDIDELGRILYTPKIELDAMSPVWIYNDDNSSILQPAISLDNDLYGVPNVVDVIYSTDEHYFNVRVTNDDDDSPVSIKNRGREILHRVINPEISGYPTIEKVQAYAESLLKEMSSMEYTMTYSHGFCPTKVGDCVILNYKKAGLHNVKAKVISQSITCVSGVQVEEKVKFINKLWG